MAGIRSLRSLSSRPVGEHCRTAASGRLKALMPARCQRSPEGCDRLQAGKGYGWTHSRERATARCHWAYRRSRSSTGIFGCRSRSQAQLACSSAKSDQ